MKSKFRLVFFYLYFVEILIFNAHVSNIRSA